VTLRKIPNTLGLGSFDWEVALMSKNKVTAELLEILESHPHLKYDFKEGIGADWFQDELKRQTWLEPIDTKSVLSRLEDLLEDFQAQTEISIEEYEIYRDAIEAEILATDTIAFYKSFRGSSSLALHSDWGIYLNLLQFFSFNRRIAKIAGTQEIEALEHV